jgi:hypothetical protein
MFCLKCILTNDITDPSTFLPHLLFPFTSPLIIYFYLLMNNVVSTGWGWHMSSSLFFTTMVIFLKLYSFLGNLVVMSRG